MCDEWVQKKGIKIDGSEFAYTYKTCLNATYEPFTPLFVSKFRDLVSTIMSDRTVRMIFRMVLGGGQVIEH